MKKNKGFTLVELIAVIAILGVILTIASISMVSIKENILKRQKANLQSTIRIAAEGYHEDTGIDSIPVGILLQIGAIQADEVTEDGTPIIIDPVDGKDISCDTVEFKADGSSTYVESDTCSAESIAENALTLKIRVGSEDDTYENYLLNHNGWITPLNGNKIEDVYFYSAITKLKTDGTVTPTYLWTNPLSPDKSGEGENYKLSIPDSHYIESTYNLYVDLKGTYTEDGEKSTGELSKNFDVKLDANRPTIDQIFVLPNEEWARSKNIIATLIDNESGIAAYKVIRGNGADCSTDTSEWKTVSDASKKYEMSETVDVNSEYYKVCAKDVAGYITSSEYVTVKNVDGVAPEIQVSVDNTNYQKSHNATITIKEKGPDGVTYAGFGNDTLEVKYLWSETAIDCTKVLYTGTSATITVQNNGQETFSKSVTISTGTGDGKIYVCPVTVKDRLGNTLDATTPVAAGMKMDNQIPSIGSVTINSNNENYHSATVSVTVNGIADTHSGNAQVCVSKSSSSCTNWQTISKTTTSYTFNDQSAGTDGSGANVTFYAFAKDAAGNVMTSGTSGSYTIYTYCTETQRSGESGYGSCSKQCDGGTQYRDVYYVDKYFTSTSCPTAYNAESQSCNTRSCCTSSTITYKDGTKCSADCDWGTYNRVAYSTYDNSVRCPSYDKDTGGSSCYLKACCSEGTYTNYSCNSSGYWVQRRYNECLGKYETRTTSNGCTSSCKNYSYGSCSGSGGCGWGSQKVTCTYYYAGTAYTETDYEDCYEDYDCCDTSYYQYIGGTRYSGCTAYYITYCQVDSECVSNAKCKTSSGTTVTRSTLKVSEPSSCSGGGTSTTLTYNCKIRGTNKRSLSYSWNCTGGHTGHTQGYYIYCRRSDGQFKSAKEWRSAGVSIDATLVCPTNPYGTANGWELYSD